VEPFVRVTGIAAPLLVDNVDTDAIIPSRETQSVSRTGYGEKLFANWRYAPGTRDINPDFVLNQAPYDHAVILVTGQNFGCGSSREAAVWSLMQFGIRCVIGGSFGAIFRTNAIRNGLLPVALDDASLSATLSSITSPDSTKSLTVDLEKCAVQLEDGRVFPFSIGPLDREMLLSGANEIELTLRRRTQIDTFRNNDRQDRPWVYQARWMEGT
jgi:3-isopropylmalate/(R)-2-methylmalate dehydratase small subunit